MTVVRHESVGNTNADGIYTHDEVAKGKEIGMACPAGFSYKIQYDSLIAAANGEPEGFAKVDDMSKADLASAQEKYVSAIIDGFDKAVKKVPPQWVQGKAVARVRPNYYPAGFADPIDLTLSKDAFPYDATSPAGKAMHDDLQKKIKAHWSDITD